MNDWQLIKSSGPKPFITRQIYQKGDLVRMVWRSRHHRKGWQGFSKITLQKLNWWIGIIFAVGSFLFMLGSILVLYPNLAKVWSLDFQVINGIFFAGSIPFTTAAYLQLFQSANTPKFSPNTQHSYSRTRRWIWFGWSPHDLGWLSCALQFLGTILFNYNTFDAMLPNLNWLEKDLAIWIPDFFGSVLFLVSGYLAFMETCHGYWGWQPASLSWWVTFVNLVGCLGFMISAVFAVFLPQSPSIDIATISVFFTLIGAVGFLIGSLLMLLESAIEVRKLQQLGSL